jgi:DNA-binding NtrC family response regulator
VLVVDDELGIAGLLVRLLELLKYPASAIGSPEQALELVRNEPERFGMVITDMSMPTMSGVDLASALRHAAPKLRLVLSSGTDFTLAGTAFDDVLPKPYTLGTLEKLLARHERARSGASEPSA